MLSKNLLSIELDEALTRDKCPFCRLNRYSSERYIWTLIYENTSDQLICQQFIDTLGFCKDHGHLLIKIVKNRHLLSGAGVASLYEKTIPRYLKLLNTDLTEKEHNWHKKFFPISLKKDKIRTENKTSNQLDCIACSHSQETVQNNIKTFIENMADTAYQKFYQKSDGLCQNHLNEVLKNIKPENNQLRSYLIADQTDRLNELLEKLQQLQRKKRYDIKEKLTTAETISWQEAIWRFTGWEPEQLIGNFRL